VDGDAGADGAAVVAVGVEEATSGDVEASGSSGPAAVHADVRRTAITTIGRSRRTCRCYRWTEAQAGEREERRARPPSLGRAPGGFGRGVPGR
jgi:hypothetical protein